MKNHRRQLLPISARRSAAEYPGDHRRGLVHRHHDRQAGETRKAPQRLSGICSAQSLRRHHHRRGRPNSRAASAPPGSGNIGKPVRHVRGRARHRLPGSWPTERPRQLRQPLLHASCRRRDAAVAAHFGWQDKADRLAAAMHLCTETERRVVMTGHRDGASCAEFGDYLLKKL